MAHRRMVLLTLAALAAGTPFALAQGTFPAPLPGQGATLGPPSSSPLRGATPAPPSECMKGFYPLREDAENKGKIIKAAGDRHAPPDEVCKLITSYGAAEVEMIKYVDANASQCGIPTTMADQLRAGHKNTEALQIRVCSAAELSQRRRQPRGPVGDFPDTNGRF